MDSILRKKIEKFHGWDFCEHGLTRNYCPECKWDVPAYMRKEEISNLERESQEEVPDLEKVDQLELPLDK